MIIKELDKLSDENISDLLGLMRELDSTVIVTPAILKAAADDPSTHLFAAFEDGRLIGTASLCVTQSPIGRKGGIEDVVVCSDFRGRHIGRQLIAHILDFAKQNLAPIEIHLTSRPSRIEANQLYQAMGFVRHETNVYKLHIN